MSQMAEERPTRAVLGGPQSSADRTVSHGRGGAGNQRKEPKDTQKESLDTPTIKQTHYTTGRGGSGNIATNDATKPEVARAAQDVGPVPAKETQGTVHIGRGGAANTAYAGEQLKGKGVVDTILEKVGLKK